MHLDIECYRGWYLRQSSFRVQGWLAMCFVCSLNLLKATAGNFNSFPSCLSMMGEDPMWLKGWYDCASFQGKIKLPSWKYTCILDLKLHSCQDELLFLVAPSSSMCPPSETGQLKRAAVERPPNFAPGSWEYSPFSPSIAALPISPSPTRAHEPWLAGLACASPAFAHALSVQALMLQSASILLLRWIGQLLVFYYDFIFLVHHSKQTGVWSMAVSISVSLQVHCRMPSSTPLIPESPVSASCWQQKYSSTAGLIQNSIFHHLQLPAGVQGVVRWLLSLSNSICQYLSLAPSAEAIFVSARAG